MNILDYNALDGHTLKEVLKVKVLTGAAMLTTVDRASVMALDWNTAGTLDVFNTAGNLEAGESDTFQVIVYWAPGAGDNLLNVNNGKNTTDGQPLFINFGINVVASQLNYENDSFGPDYDQGIALPDLPVSINKTFQSAPIESNSVTESVQVKNVSTNAGIATVEAASVNAVIGALKTQATDIAENSDLSTVIYLDVQTADKSETSVTYEIGMSATLTYKDSAGNTKTTTLNSLNGNLADKIVTATMDIGKGLSNVTVKHSGVPMAQLASESADAEGYYYNKTTGVLTIKSKSFSPFTVDYTIEGVAAVGDAAYATLEEALNAANDGDTVVLLRDITFANNPYYVLEVKPNTVINLNSKTITVPFMSAIFQGSNFTIKNGTFTSDASYALWIGDEGTTDSVVIDNVTVNGGINVYNATNVTLRNVTADATGHTYYAVWADANARITIDSGKYTGENGKVAILSYDGSNGGEPGKITVTGGKFSSDPSRYCAEGKMAVEGTDGMYEIVNDTRVKTEADLKTAVEAGGEVTLGADITLTSTLSITKDVTLNLGAYTISGKEKSSAVALKNDSGTIKVVVNATTGGITASGSNGNCFEIPSNNNGTVELTINGGNYSSTNAYFVNINAGSSTPDGRRDKLFINGGTYSGNRIICVNPANTEITITNGSLTATGSSSGISFGTNSNNSKLTITGGELKHESGAVITAQAQGNTIDIRDNAVVTGKLSLKNCTMNITGGCVNITGTDNRAIIVSNGTTMNIGGNAKVKGDALFNINGGTVNITGGMFSGKIVNGLNYGDDSRKSVEDILTTSDYQLSDQADANGWYQVVATN